MSIVSYNPRLRPYQAAANYALGVNPITYNLAENISGGAIFQGGLIFAGQGYKGLSWLYENKGNYSNAWQRYLNTRNLNIANDKAIKGKNIFETAKNRIGNNSLKMLEAKIAEVKPMNYSDFAQLNKKAQIKYNNNIIKSNYYKEVRKLIAKAKGTKGAELKSYLKQIDEAMAKAQLNIHNAKVSGIITPATKRGKILAGIKKYSGYNKAAGKIAEKSVTSKTLRTLAKGAKGNAAAAIITTAIEIPELVKTFKECGNKKGMKQLGKTAMVVGAEIGGYAAGAAAGAAIGASIGTAACPIIGTAIGAICGIAVSCISGWLARKAVGKSELEKHKEQKALELAQTAIKDQVVKKELLTTCTKKVQESGETPDEELLKAYEQILSDAESKEYHIQKTNNENAELLSMLSDIQNMRIYG